MLEMKSQCERCQKALPANLSGALICSYECTWRESCAAELSHRCPNCTGELLARPTRSPG
jgi:hypothetical protein